MTAIPTIVRYGLRRSARVLFFSGESRNIDPSTVRNYVSESENPANRLDVRAVEVLHPHPLLASGLCLVDTPGLGSVYEMSTAKTHAFLPHVDAAVVVIGGDPPISADEVALMQQISPQVGRMEIVLNKADRLSPLERLEAKEFARKVLDEALDRELPTILEASATDALEGRETYDFAEFRLRMESCAASSGADLVGRAVERGIARVVLQIREELGERRKALLRPAEESAKRLSRLANVVREAEPSRGDLYYLFQAEQDRLSASHGELRDQFIAVSLAQTEGQLRAEFERVAGGGPRGSAVRQIARRRIESWLNEIEPVAEAAYRNAMRRFAGIVDDFLERISGATELGEGFTRFEPESGFRSRRRFYFADLFELAPPEGGPTGWIRSDERSRSRAFQYLRDLLEHNSTRIVNDLDERVMESRRGLEIEVSNTIRSRLEMARRAGDRARSFRNDRAEALEAELRRIDDLEAQVATFTVVSSIALSTKSA